MEMCRSGILGDEAKTDSEPDELFDDEEHSRPPGHHRPPPQLAVAMKHYEGQWRPKEPQHQSLFVSLSPLEMQLLPPSSPWC
jgi:hypothetical protein